MMSEVEQQSTTEAGAAAASLHAAAPKAAAAAAGPVLSVLSLEGSKLKLMLSGMSTLTLSAYHIDTELLFTTQPFSSPSVAAGPTQSSVSHTNTAPGADLAAKVHGADSGLGKVAFVQPTARVVLQLPLQSDTPGVAAVTTATPGTGSAASRVREAVLPDASTDEESAANAAGSAGECCCVLTVDVLMPQLASQSVLLEVAGGGLARTLPR
jgi:hypothetical protein